MQKTEKTVLSRFQEPWMRVVLYVTLMLFLPEYLSPVMAFLALLAARKDVTLRGASLRGGSFALPLFLYLIYTVIGLTYADNTLSALGAVGLWSVMPLLYVSLTSVLTERRRLNAALAYFSVGIGINGAIACVQYIAKATFKLNVDMQCWAWLDRILNTICDYPVFDDFGNRASASFMNPNVLAEFMIIFLPFMFYLLSRKTNDRRRPVVRMAAILTIFGLLFTFCRGAYLALGLILALFFAMNVRKAPLLLLIALAVLLLIPSGVYARLFSISDATDYAGGVIENAGDGEGDSLLDNIIDNAEDPQDGKTPNKSLSERVQVWAASLDAILKRPLFGYGPGGHNIKALLQSYDVAPPHAHNLVLQLLLEGGIFSLLMWLAIAFSAVRKGYRLLMRSHRPQIGMAVLAFVCGFCMISMTDYPFLTPKLIGGVVVALGLIDVIYEIYAPNAAKLRPLKDCILFLPQWRKK